MRQLGIWTVALVSFLLTGGMTVKAEETVTVSSTGTDISENLDLKAVASLFGEVDNLEKFEAELNSEERHINNLDLNGDGVVDYLRVVEIGEGSNRLIVIQAVLAKDIYQDVASIYVEKKDETVSVQVIGDEYIYGTNYIIEPVYVYRPVIYNWFWSPAWVCWHSPYYWGYYPSCCCCYGVWSYPVYCSHIHVYHTAHVCSYRYASVPRSGASTLRSSRAGMSASRTDMAQRSPDRSFAARNAQTTNVSNARQLTSSRPRQSSAAVAGVRNVSSAANRTMRTESPSVSCTTASAASRTQGTRAIASNNGTYARSSRSVESSARTAGTSSSRTDASASITRSHSMPSSSSSSSSSSRTYTTASSPSSSSSRSGYSVSGSRSTSSAPVSSSRSSMSSSAPSRSMSSGASMGGSTRSYGGSMGGNMGGMRSGMSGGMSGSMRSGGGSRR